MNIYADPCSIAWLKSCTVDYETAVELLQSWLREAGTDYRLPLLHHHCEDNLLDARKLWRKLNARCVNCREWNGDNAVYENDHMTQASENCTYCSAQQSILRETLYHSPPRHECAECATVGFNNLAMGRQLREKFSCPEGNLIMFLT